MARNVVPACRAFNNANLAIATGLATMLTLNSEVRDNFTTPMHSTAVNTSRITAPIAGWYAVSFMAQFEASALGTFRLGGIRVNGANQVVQSVKAPTPGGAVATDVNCATEVYLAQGDFIEGLVKHDAGVARNIVFLVDTTPYLAAVWLGS